MPGQPSPPTPQLFPTSAPLTPRTGRPPPLHAAMQLWRGTRPRCRTTLLAFPWAYSGNVCPLRVAQHEAKAEERAVEHLEPSALWAKLEAPGFYRGLHGSPSTALTGGWHAHRTPSPVTAFSLEMQDSERKPISLSLLPPSLGIRAQSQPSSFCVPCPTKAANGKSGS